MYQYKLSSGLYSTELMVEKPFYKDDATAWAALRKLLPHKFATLYRWTTCSVLINQHKHCIQEHNAHYSDKLPDSMYRQYGYWKPVLYGLTDDEYKIGE